GPPPPPTGRGAPGLGGIPDRTALLKAGYEGSLRKHRGSSAMRDCERRGRYQQGMTNQWRRAAAVVAVAAMTLAACGTTPPAASGTPAASATVASKRGAGDDLKILYWQAPTILNAHLATGTKDSDAARLVTEPLASYGADAKPLAN